MTTKSILKHARRRDANSRCYMQFKMQYFGVATEEEANDAFNQLCDSGATQPYWDAEAKYFADRKGVALCSNHSKLVSSVNPDEVIYPSRSGAQTRNSMNRHHSRQLSSVRFQREQRRRMALAAAGIAA